MEMKENCDCFYCRLSLGGKVVASATIDIVPVLLAAVLCCGKPDRVSVMVRVNSLRKELFEQAVKSCEESVAAGHQVSGSEFAYRLLTLTTVKAGELLKEVGSPMEREAAAKLAEAQAAAEKLRTGYSLN